jgi:hypothetical protein
VNHVLRRWFGRAAPTPDVSDWWARANAAANAPTAAALAELRSTQIADDAAPDLAEAQQEMLDGLEALAKLMASDRLPVVATQHRVIGTDICHYLAPASLVDQVDAPGKVFVTSARLIFAAGTAQSWPQHHIAGVDRYERDVLVDLRGRPPIRLRLNSYESALVTRATIERLANRP